MTDEDWRRYVLSHRSACAAEKEQQSAAELRDEVAHLEARRGALLAEVDRLTADVKRLREREEHFASALAVADGGQYRADWNGAIRRVLRERDTARADGAREMRERAAKACEAVMDAQPRSSLGDVAMCCRADVLSLPLPGEEVARG